MTKMTLLAGVAGAFLATAAAATPLTLLYTVTDLGGSYRYDFALTLDNHDGTWAAGQAWDAIVFGDSDEEAAFAGFDPDGAGPLKPDWTTLVTDDAIAFIGGNAGAHNGPTLVTGPGPNIPGWTPAAIGDTLRWSGTSSVLLSDGLRWSALFPEGGAQIVNFEVARLVAPSVDPVPEPAMLGLFGLGLAGLGVARRRKTAN